MYTTDYFYLFCETLDLPADCRAPLTADYERLLADDAAMAEIRAAGEKLFSGEEWPVLEPHMNAAHAAAGLHRHTVDFLFLMAQSERMLSDYERAGLSHALFWDTIADLKFKLLECRAVYGIWGTFVAFWHPWFFTLRRFKLGRMQFEAISFSHTGPVTLGGQTITPGDTVYNLHIPASGEPFDRTTRLSSYRRAYDFFKDKLDGRPMAFVCHSWLLFPGNREILPASSNIVDFISDFHIYQTEESEKFSDCWRVFGRDFEKPAADLPEDTSMRRAFKAWLLSGRKTGSGCGMFLFDGERFYRS